nr:type VI secretion system-associated protein TagF [Oleomonas cavernae]
MPLEPVIVPGSQVEPAPAAPAVTSDVVPAEEGRPPPIAGLYGKLPARGDFVERRLSSQFIDRWDRFLNEGMVAASGVLGERFTDLYLVSPFWRFALGAGVAGDGTVVGVFAPASTGSGAISP